jgi:hypothetical protein
VIPPLLFPELELPPELLLLAEEGWLLDELEPPRARAQRARAAAASLARVAADIGRRRPSCFAAALPPPVLLLPIELLPALLVLRLLLPPKIELSRRSSSSICSRIATASFNLSRDKSMDAY